MAFAVGDVRARDADFDDRARSRHWRHPNLEVASLKLNRDPLGSQFLNDPADAPACSSRYRYAPQSAPPLATAASSASQTVSNWLVLRGEADGASASRSASGRGVQPSNRTTVRGERATSVLSAR